MRHVLLALTLACTLLPAHGAQIAQTGKRISSKHEECLEFLLNNLPESDRSLDRRYLTTNVKQALQARAAQKWAAAVPWDLFLRYVCPYASLDERRDDWRPLFHTLFSPMVAGASSLTDAAQILNRSIWKIWNITFMPDQTPEIMSPFQVIEAGHASCTGVSIFLVNACRSVGIPARVVGTPSWNTGSKMISSSSSSDNRNFNNHNWVEIWDGGAWSFTGALEPKATMNSTWFFPEPARHQVPGDRYHAIYAASFDNRTRGVTYPLVWDEKWRQPGLDITRSYLDA